ncbi:MAG: hypothetical protein GMKNLPBB_00112 [Myxococcota bacterium]|nr:hypothetical protein [Myxococcota bacterium]
MVAGRAAIASITVPLGMLLGLGGLIQHRLRSRRPGRNPHAPAREGRA